jgi:hypothetical protein
VPHPDIKLCEIITCLVPVPRLAAQFQARTLARELRAPVKAVPGPAASGQRARTREHLLALAMSVGFSLLFFGPWILYRIIWQAETGFSFRLAGGFFGVTPPGLHPPAAQAVLGSGTVTGATATSIRSFLRSHHVGAVLMAEEPAAIVHTTAQATGVAGVREGGMVVFRLDRASVTHR